MSKSIFSNDTGFAKFMNVLADVLIIGILWIICCIPVITAGTATSAAYYAMSKTVRYSEGYVAKNFFHGFKVNFRQSVMMTVLFFIGLALIVVDIIFTWGNRSTLNDSMFIVMCLVGFILLTVAIYYCVLISRFTKTTGQLLKLSFVVGFRYLYVTVPLFIVISACFVALYLMPWLLVFLPGLFMFALTYPMEWIMHKLMPKPEEGSIEADKWYYGDGKVFKKSEDDLQIVGREKRSGKDKISHRWKKK